MTLVEIKKFKKDPYFKDYIQCINLVKFSTKTNFRTPAFTSYEEIIARCINTKVEPKNIIIQPIAVLLKNNKS